MTLSSLLKPSTKPMTLRATGAGVNTIDLLPPSKTNCLSLYISYNSISSLENITQFKKLKELLMDFNEISRIEDLGPLSTLKNLTVLHIEGNPVCNLPLWDLHLLTFCPKLRVLNGQKTKDFLYSKSQIQHFLEIESKFHQFIIISKFVTKVLKLKIMDTNLTFGVAAKITQSSMFKDPNYNNNYANKLRLQCSKVNVEGYFSLMRRKLLAQHSKISELSKTAQVPSKTHSIIYDQIKLITDYDAFLESMQDLQDSSLQVIGIGSGPVIVVQPKPDQFILSRRSFQSRSERYSRSDMFSNSNKQSNIKAENDAVSEEEEIGEAFFNSTNNNDQQKDSNNGENFKNVSEIDIELEAEINEDNNGENDQNLNVSSEIKISKLSETNPQVNLEVTTSSQENNQQPSTAASVVDRSIEDSIAIIQSPQSAYSQSDANKLTQNRKNAEDKKSVESLDHPDEKMLAQDSIDAQSQDQNMNENEMLSEGSNSEKGSNLNDQERNKDDASEKSQNQETEKDSQSQSSTKSANSQKNKINNQKLNFNEEGEEENEKTNKDSHSDTENQLSDKNQSEAQQQSSHEHEDQNDQKDSQSQSSKKSEKSNKQNQIQKTSEDEAEADKENNENEEEGVNEVNPKENENDNLDNQQSNENESQNQSQQDQNTTEIHSPFFDTEEENQNESINQNQEEEDNDQISSQIKQQKKTKIQTQEDDQIDSQTNQQQQIEDFNEEEEETNDQQLNANSNRPHSNQEEEELNENYQKSSPTATNQNQNEFEIEEEEEEAPEPPSTKHKTRKIVTISNEDEVQFDFEIEEEENDHFPQKRSRRVKKRNLRAISDIDTDYAQSLSDTDTPGKPILNNVQPKVKKGQISQQEEQFIFEKSRSKSSFKSYDDNEMSSSVSNGPKSILRKPSKTATGNETDETNETELTDENGYGENKVKQKRKTSLAISRADIKERESCRDGAKSFEHPSSCFDACSDKSSDFNDFRLQTVKINLVPSSYGLLQISFSKWKRRLRKRKNSQRPSQQFARYVDLLNQLDSKTLEIKKEKKEQAKKSASTAKNESQRGDQLRQISLKQELKRKIEHQKEINKALQKRLDQYVSENQSLQGFLDSPFEQNFAFNNLTMSYSQKSQSMKNKKKKKDSLTAQYCAMLREKK